MTVPPRHLLLVILLLVCACSACNRGEQPARAGAVAPNTTKTISSTSAEQKPAAEDAVTKTVDAAPTTSDPAPVEQPTQANAPVKDVSFDDIKFDHVKGNPFNRSMLTPAVKKLTGKPIRIRGYILPSFQQNGIKKFVLVRDNMQCCFGPGAAFYDCIVVDMAEGASADFTVRPVSVEGVFNVDEVVGAEGNTLAVYHLDGKEVK